MLQHFFIKIIIFKRDFKKQTIHHRHKEQGDDGGKEKPENDGQCEWFPKQSAAKEQRQHAQRGGEGGEQYGPEPVMRCQKDGVAPVHIGVLGYLHVDAIDKDNGVVYHYPGQGDDTQHAKETHERAANKPSGYRSDHAQRNGQNNNGGFANGVELEHQQNHDEEKRQRQT